MKKLRELHKIGLVGFGIGAVYGLLIGSLVGGLVGLLIAFSFFE